MNKDIVKKFFPQAIKNIEAGKCAMCGGEAGTFQNNLSLKEFEISGMCQKCQDNVFGK